MLPTDILSSEHRVIEQVIGCLEKIADKCESEGTLDLQDTRDAIDFIRNFADRCHHLKEEDILFEKMIEKGFPKEGGPIYVMLMDHEQGRAHVKAMDESAEAASGGNSDSAKTFVNNARGYAGLLREHIIKEDHILYVMANQAFNDADQQDLLHRFEHVEHHDMGEGTHEKYLGIADRLGQKYGVERTTSSSPGAMGCFTCH